MRRPTRLTSLLGMVIVTIGLLYLEAIATPPDWKSSLGRLAFFWLGGLAVLLPDLTAMFDDQQARRRRRRSHHRRSRTDGADE